MDWFEDAATNRALWTKTNAEYTDGEALEAWRREPSWGSWHVPDAELGVFARAAHRPPEEIGITSKAPPT